MKFPRPHPKLPLFVDIDGTMTHKEVGLWGEPRMDVIDHVRSLCEEDEIVVWSGGGSEYARAFCEKYDIHPIAAIGKPGTYVDDNPKMPSVWALIWVSIEEFLRRKETPDGE